MISNWSTEYTVEPCSVFFPSGNLFFAFELLHIFWGSQFSRLVLLMLFGCFILESNLNLNFTCPPQDFSRDWTNLTRMPLQGWLLQRESLKTFVSMASGSGDHRNWLSKWVDKISVLKNTFSLEQTFIYIAIWYIPFLVCRENAIPPGHYLHICRTFVGSFRAIPFKMGIVDKIVDRRNIQYSCTQWTTNISF